MKLACLPGKDAVNIHTRTPVGSGSLEAKQKEWSSHCELYRPHGVWYLFSADSAPCADARDNHKTQVMTRGEGRRGKGVYPPYIQVWEQSLLMAPSIMESVFDYDGCVVRVNGRLG